MRFGFVVHPLSASQRRLLGVRSFDGLMAIGRPTRRPPARPIARLRVRDPFDAQVEGVLVAIPSLPEELLVDQEAGVAAVVEAVARCRAEGADVVGLGAVAAVIGGQGKAVAEASPCPVSTGNGLTAWAAVETLELLRGRGLRGAPVGLVGPPGPVANGILEQLLARGDEVVIVSAQPPRPLIRQVEQLCAQHRGRARFTAHVSEVLGPGKVLIAASSTGGRLRLSALPAGSVIIDVAAPQDVLLDVPTRKDVLLLDGEYVRLPRPLAGSAWHHVYGWVTGQSQHIFACFAEPMLMALAGDTALCSVGRTVPLERLRALGNLAASHGFWIDRLHEQGRPVPLSRLQRFVAG